MMESSILTHKEVVVVAIGLSSPVWLTPLNEILSFILLGLTIIFTIIKIIESIMGWVHRGKLRKEELHQKKKGRK